ETESTALERALRLLAWAHQSGNETLERKTLERVAAELDIEDVDELSRQARELAWSEQTPQDDDVESLSEKARETGEGGSSRSTAATPSRSQTSAKCVRPRGGRRGCAS